MIVGQIVMGLPELIDTLKINHEVSELSVGQCSEGVRIELKHDNWIL